MQAARSRGASAATAAAFVASGTTIRPPAEARDCSDAHHHLEYDPARIISMPSVSANHLEAAAAQVTGRGGGGGAYSRGGGHGRGNSGRSTYRSGGSSNSGSGTSEQQAVAGKKAPFTRTLAEAPDVRPDDEVYPASEEVAAPIASDRRGSEATAAAATAVNVASAEPATAEALAETPEEATAEATAAAGAELAAAPPETLAQHLTSHKASGSIHSVSSTSMSSSSSSSSMDRGRGALSSSGGDGSGVSQDCCAAFMADVALRVACDPRVQASVLDHMHWPAAANAKEEGPETNALAMPPLAFPSAFAAASLGSHQHDVQRDEQTEGVPEPPPWAAAPGDAASLSDDWALVDSPLLSNSSPSSSFSVEPPPEKASSSSFDTVATSNSSSSSSLGSGYSHSYGNGDFSGVGAAMLMESQEWEASCAVALNSTETEQPLPMTSPPSLSPSPSLFSELEALEKQQQHFDNMNSDKSSDIHRNQPPSTSGNSGGSGQVRKETTPLHHHQHKDDGDADYSSPLAMEVASLRAEVAAAQRHLAVASERNADLALANQALHRELCDVYRRLGELSGLGQANDAGDGGWTASGNSNAPGSSGAGDRESTSKTEGANGDQVARAAKLLREAQNAFAWPRPATVASATAAANSAAAAAAAGAAGTSTATGGGDKGDEGSVAMATLFSDAMTAAAGGKGGGFASSSSSREAQVAWAVQGILEDCQRQQQRLNEHSVVLKSSHKQHDNVDVQDSHDNNNDDEDCDVAFGDEDLDALIRGAAYTAAISIVVVAALQARKSPLALQMAEAARAAFQSSVVNVAAAASKMATWPLLE